MKQHFYLSTLFLLCSFFLIAQTPQKICYQAAAKDTNSEALASQVITVRATILKNDPNGTIEWQEQHNPTTDSYGLFVINIGDGLYLNGIQTNFSEIDWGNGTYWLRIEMDATGGQNYVLMGTSQMLSVPYALHAERANIANTAIFADSAAVAGTAQFAEMANSVAGDNDLDETNELQELVSQNGELFLQAQGGILSGNGVTFDSSNTNELQDIAVIAGELYLKNQDGSTSSDGISYDDSNTNEIQNLITQNDTLYLQAQDGTLSVNGIYLPVDNDTSATNEIQELAVQNGNLTITGGNEISLTELNPLGGAGSSSDFPQGILGEYMVLTTGTYSVPTGKTLWITAGGPIINIRDVGNANLLAHPTTPNMPVFGAGTVIEDCRCTAILVEDTPAIVPVILDFVSGINNYIVPEEKVLFIKSGLKNDQIGRLRVNNEEFEFLRPSLTRGTRIIAFPENTMLQAIPDALGGVDMVLTGYLLDKAILDFD